MGRIPCCEKDSVKRGQWTPEEDNKLSSYIAQHGTRNWRVIPKNAGLQRCGKSCRLRWTNYLRPDLKRGDFTGNEEQTIVKLHAVVGNRWSLIAAQLPGRTDNDVKNYWNTKLKKKLSGMGIDPVTHKPFSHLMAEIATTLAPPQVAHLAEAALGCFKDEMLHLLTKKCVDFTAAGPLANSGEAVSEYAKVDSDKEETIKKIKLGLSREMHEPINDTNNTSPPTKPWILLGSDGEPSDGLMSVCNNYTTGGLDRFGFGDSSYLNNGEGSSWNQSLCGEGTCIGVAATGPSLGDHLADKSEDDDGEDAQGGKLLRKDNEGLFESECGLWDLTDDLMIQ